MEGSPFFKKVLVCATCGGTGQTKIGELVVDCPACKGQGRIEIQRYGFPAGASERTM